MKTLNGKMGAMLAVFAVSVLGLTQVGCLGGDDGTGSDDEFAMAVPDDEMLDLSLDGDGLETQSSALEVEGQALVGEPAKFKKHAKDVMAAVNALIAETYAEVQALFAGVEPVETTKGAWTCKTWEDDGVKAHWKLTVCLKDKNLKKYGFELQGRPIGSTSDKDYLVVFAGAAKLFPKFEEKKRGAGYVGYNFDNLNQLTGRPLSGRLGVGYRAVGKVRQAVLGLDHVNAEAVDHEMNGIYRYARIVGIGGRFSFVGKGDYIAMEDGKVVIGQDQLVERVRAAIGWKATGEARTVLKACDGTAGDGQCLKLVQCWSKDEAVAYEEAGDDAMKPKWEEKTCSELPMPVDDAPAETDEDVPDDGNDIDAPMVPEPSAVPEEE